MSHDGYALSPHSAAVCLGIPVAGCQWWDRSVSFSPVHGLPRGSCWATVGIRMLDWIFLWPDPVGPFLMFLTSVYSHKSRVISLDYK